MKSFKNHMALKICALVLAAILIFFAIINLVPPRKSVEYNPFIKDADALPMIAAHRGGGDNRPENTMLAFRHAVTEIGVDIIESDLYLTKDGHLVFNHDAYIDRTSNVNGDISYEEMKELIKDKSKRHYISDMTLSELRQYNFGYYFENENGERIYKDEADLKGAGIEIATVDMLFEEFHEEYPNLKFIVEIKDGGERGVTACEVLSGVLNDYPVYMKNTVIGTFNDEIELELKNNYNDLLRGAPVGSAAKFIITEILKVNLFDTGDFACLQIPLSYDIGFELSLERSDLISRAHRRNIAVQYWTVNDPDEMRRLIELGCDAIMTDNPELMRQILSEYEK